MPRFKSHLLTTTIFCSAIAGLQGVAHAQDAAAQPGTQQAGIQEVVQAQDVAAQPLAQQTGPQDTAAAVQPEEESASEGGQDAAAPTASTTNVDDGSSGEEIVVTGSILRRTNIETPSPVTVLSAESLEQRGINTASEALQRVSANNAGTIQSGWNTGNNFASGATAPALRGLSVQNTLSVFDGLRMAPYPLADDGQRNFVDLSSIPAAIIDRIEVLRDGASSTYGADAIAGVVNIITKKEIQGLHIGASAGVSQRGDAGEQRFDVTWGHGDLDEDGFNFYVSGEYQNNEEFWARDRGFPFNTADLSSICNSMGSCMSNGNPNGISANGFYNGSFAIPGVAWVRPVDDTPLDPNNPNDLPPNPLTGAGQFQFLNPAAGCGAWNTVHPEGLPATTTVPVLNGLHTSCETNLVESYNMLSPDIERKGLTARTTVNIGDDHQIYAMGTYYQTDTFTSFSPLNFHGTPAAPNPAGLPTYNVMQPVYVCSTGVGTMDGTNTGCDASNGVLNPYNPFAADGRTAQMFVRSTRPRTVETKSRALRGVIGLSGTIFDDVRYSTDFVASSVRLKRIQGGNMIPQRVANAVARGEINFLDLEATPESVWDYISPTQKTTSTSNLWQWQGSLAKDIMELAGGPLQAAVGLQYRHEAIDAPSGNPPGDGISDNPYDRYYSINAVGTKGSRNVKSAFFELNAPFIEQVELNLSGRYDKYSTGQSSFSPKAGIKVTPIKELALRGTWSKGFRAPSFNESFGLPTTGFVTREFNCTEPANADLAAFCNAHGNNAYADSPFSIGLTQVGNPDLDPEKSTAFTAGLIFEPIRNISFTVDFWNIKIKNLIVGVSDIGPVIDAYYANNGVVDIPGFTVTPANPDVAFPNALPQIGYIESSYKNADQQLARGIDFGINSRYNITDGLRWSSSLEASYLLKYELITETGDTQRFDGTLSPCNVTSCSGAPKWRASWQNTLEFGDTTLTATVYYTGRMGLESTDFGATRGDCDSGVLFGSVPTYQDGSPVMCKSKPIWNVDFTAAHEISDKLTIYANVLNVFDDDPPFDHAAAYGLFNFNPAWAGPNIMGRYFRVGAKVDF